MSYDPTFAHEVAVIMQDGLRRMVQNQENVFYYITLLTKTTPCPACSRARSADHQGHVPGKPGQKVPQSGLRVQLLGSGTILRESLFAQELLEKDWQIAADVWSCPSFNELTRDGQNCERHNMLHPLETAKVPFVTQQLQGTQGPVIASTDYMKAYAEQIRPYIPKGRNYKVLGTDGFGRSDFRRKLREHFEVDRHFIVVAALKALAEEGKLPVTKVAEAIVKYGIKADKINPLYA